MNIYFSKKNFKENSDRTCRVALKEHLDVLDGMKVTKTEDGKDYEIAQYEVNGDQFYLCPIPIEWCQTTKQLSMF